MGLMIKLPGVHITGVTTPQARLLSAGKFGERWTKIARAYGLTVVEHTERWASAFDPDKVAAFLDQEVEGGAE